MQTQQTPFGPTPPGVAAALITLIVLQLVMLGALLFKLPPHPPEVIPLGGMAPVLAASLSAALTALIYRGQGAIGLIWIVVACVLAGLSYGPQKYFDPAITLVWPAVLCAQIAIVALALHVLHAVVPAKTQTVPC